jgi:hypothetical protein
MTAFRDSAAGRVLAITAAAAGLGLAFWLLPARPRLTHMDFVAGGPDALEFCDAANPRFLPVVARSSPVAASLASAVPCNAGREANLVLTLRTNTGKPIGAGDLADTAGRRLRLAIVDPSLADFQAPAADPGAPGEWRFRFAPRFGGAYRVFVDFTPSATGQEMYASADLAVEGPAGPASPSGDELSAKSGGTGFTLAPSASPVRIREPVTLALRSDRGAAGAELLAFDLRRSGMVDLRLGEAGRARVSFPDSGVYALWAIVPAGGRDLSVPFSILVQP